MEKNRKELNRKWNEMKRKEMKVRLENGNKSSFKNWKENPIRKWKKNALKNRKDNPITKEQFQNGNDSKYEMKMEIKV